MAKQFNLSRLKISKSALFFGLFLLGLFSFPAEESKAESPEYDPWYYVERDEMDFIVPDKFQHFYGSAVLTEIIGPMPALAFGMLKEIHDDTDGLVGFSMKDITADVLGIMSAKFARTKNVKLWLDWDPAEETLVVNFGIRL
ncbi:MAG TPA: hypothetical protein VHP63_07900 [candidate division Zixibacteria bacterium]|nr:hypothetical protein [candidate division Zixibacteria bacterium]